MANVGPMEILVVLLIALILFGPKRIPELGQSLGRGIREFKAALEEDDEKLGLAATDDETTEAAPAAAPAERKEPR